MEIQIYYNSSSHDSNNSYITLDANIIMSTACEQLHIAKPPNSIVKSKATGTI